MQTALLFTVLIGIASAFTPGHVPAARTTSLFMAEGAEAKLVSGEELEVMLTEWDQPLVVDAYATW